METLKAILFKLKEIKIRDCGYFKNSDKLRDIFEIYVNNLYVVHYYTDSYLLSQISIMEGLHRRFISEKEKYLRKSEVHP